MTLPAPTYDLMLLLDPEAEEDVRAKLVTDASEAIAADGELLRHDRWGERALAYPIGHKATAEYHLLQFHAGSPELLSGLQRSLSIADGVMRFRIVKLEPGTPEAPDALAAAGPGRAAESESDVAAEATVAAS
jgi:small subunit ribosomal protein S6